MVTHGVETWDMGEELERPRAYRKKYAANMWGVTSRNSLRN